MIIGIDWVKSYGLLTFDFKGVHLTSEKRREQVLLKGDSYTAQVKLNQEAVAQKYIRYKVKKALQ